MNNISEYLKNGGMRISFYRESSSHEEIDVIVDNDIAGVTVRRTIPINDIDSIDDALTEMIDKANIGANMLDKFREEHDKRKEIWSLFINE